MLLELCTFKVLFYTESEGVVTSSHVTKMAVTPFNPPWPKTPLSTLTSRLYLLQNRSYCRLNFLRCGNREFCIFLQKIMENITFPIHTTKLIQMIPKHIFLPIIDCSSLYATGVTCIQGVVLCQIGECGHFRSRDKDGGHTI